MLACRICKGQSELKCMICGFKKPKAKREETNHEAAERQHYEYLQRCWQSLKKAQSLSTGLAELDAEIKAVFGPWITPPTPIPVTPLKQLYDEAYIQEKVEKNLVAAKKLYSQLFSMMSSNDRIHYRITRTEIQKKIEELNRVNRK